MRYPRRSLVLTGLALATTCCLALGAAAQPASAGAQASEPVLAAYSPEPDYGTATSSILHVSITAFRSAGSTYSLTTSNTGAIYFYQDAPAAQNDWWSQVSLPNGAIVIG